MLDILFKRRSIRRYKSKAIEREKVDSILKAALHHLLQGVYARGSL